MNIIHGYMSMQFLRSNTFLAVALVVFLLGMTGCTLQKEASVDISDSSAPVIVTEDALNASSAEVTDTDGDARVDIETKDDLMVK
jgi:hypothetical protein